MNARGWQIMSMFLTTGCQLRNLWFPLPSMHEQTGSQNTINKHEVSLFCSTQHCQMVTIATLL
jgi:hypothetical protein